MEEVKTQPYGVQATPVGTTEVDRSGTWVVSTPTWVTVVRGFQLFIAFIILILSGHIIHGLALDAVCFSLACALFTFIIALYTLLTEKVTSWRRAYNHWAVIALDALMVIFWLSSMAAVAHLRSTFVVSVSADCWDDGSAVNAGHCVVSRKRGLEKRYAVATKTGLAEMSAIAGLSALMMLLFIATLVFVGHTVRMHYNSLEKGSDPATVEMNAQHQPMLNAQQPAAPAAQMQQAPGPVYSDQYQYNGQYAATQQPIQPQYTGQEYQQQSQGQQQPAYEGYSYPQEPQQQTYPQQGQQYHPPAQ